MNASRLSLDHVGISFGKRTALREATLHACGGVTAVVGPNGSGKSSLLRCAATVLAPDTGTVRIDDFDPGREHDRIEARRRIGYAPQRSDFDDRLRVATAVDYIAVLKGVTDDRLRRRRVHEALDIVGLADRATRRVGELSGGMRRRLVLAQALLLEPSLLVLDEPSSALDPDERLRLRSVLEERRRRSTVLLATHIIDEAANADTVVVLADGRVRFSGSPARVARLAEGRVWFQQGFPPPGVRASWPQPDGRHRCLGNPPPGARPVAPTLEEGYLLLQDEPAPPF